VPDGSDFLRGADRRLTPARTDLAAAHLKGAVGSARFVEATPMQVKAAIIPMRPAADTSAGVDTVLLYGERFDVYESAGDWAWGQAPRDGYVGYVPLAALSADVTVPTHMVAVPTTHLYSKNSMKTEPIASLWMTSLVAPGTIYPPNTEGVAFAEVGGVFVPAQHLVPLGDLAQDYVAVAETFLHAPYVWGGKTAAGIDCSGLVQVALARAGVDVPRDSDMQAAGIGADVGSDGPFQRGDLLFWPGHVGIMTDGETLLHATAFSMQVMREPVAVTRKRIEGDLGLPLQAVRRL
jgi:cell wall-associated NlpC family hydrolase